MTRTITHRGQEVEVTNETPLTLKGLAQFVGCGRQTIYDDQDRGYAFEFGTTTTAKHYWNWLRANPRPSKRREAASKREHELSQAR